MHCAAWLGLLGPGVRVPTPSTSGRLQLPQVLPACCLPAASFDSVSFAILVVIAVVGCCRAVVPHACIRNYAVAAFRLP